MRHGRAEPVSKSQREDAERPLCAQGFERTACAAQGLHQLVPSLEIVASSSKLRARQTAELVCEAAELSPLLQIWDELLLDESFELLAERIMATRADPVLLVGHEPNLSRFIAWLLTGNEVGMALDFKKAGVCAVDVEWSSESPSATLLWMMSPKTLRLLAK